ncbi:MAG TPA: S1/P1 nuclease [Terriglobia bacterium]|nr:S1/P1 nuclease [Terriglobia bacterium]
MARVSWESKIRARRLTIALLLATMAIQPSPVRAWGHRGHQLVNAAAIENLPEPLRSYFRSHREFLVEHAVDPDVLARDDPAERPHHYTEVEAYDTYPFANFRKQFVDERRPPTSAQLKHGDSIWQIERYVNRLTEDFRRGRLAQANHDAVFAAHYACDLTQPLHTVENYNGQLTGQIGVHARFESDVVNALADQWVLRPQPPVNETNLRARIFQEYVESYRSRYLIFASDHIAVAGHSYVDPQYRSSFENLMGPLAKKRLEAATAFVSSLWYTAWVRAGKPNLGANQKIPRRQKVVAAAAK